MKTKLFVAAARGMVIDDNKKKALRERLQSTENELRRKSQSQTPNQSFMSRNYSL